jgi:hypothetical protein
MNIVNRRPAEPRGEKIKNSRIAVRKIFAFIHRAFSGTDPTTREHDKNENKSTGNSNQTNLNCPEKKGVLSLSALRTIGIQEVIIFTKTSNATRRTSIFPKQVTDESDDTRP